tara:strand:+ start:1552 stop:1761 length:210 start_codon:yes stop_codon:yes gene_type:complete
MVSIDSSGEETSQELSEMPYLSQKDFTSGILDINISVWTLSVKAGTWNNSIQHCIISCTLETIPPKNYH